MAEKIVRPDDVTVSEWEGSVIYHKRRRDSLFDKKQKLVDAYRKFKVNTWKILMAYIETQQTEYNIEDIGKKAKFMEEDIHNCKKELDNLREKWWELILEKACSYRDKRLSESK